MTLHQLKAFVSVAKLKSFTLAGEELRLHQPSVSTAIRALERELQVKLFETFCRKVRLTKAGEELLVEAEEILGRVERMRDKVAEIKGLKKGKISVGGSALAHTLFLPIVVEEFKRQYPGVDINLKIQSSNSLEKSLMQGEIDLAVLSRPPYSPLLYGEPYLEEEIGAIAAADNPMTRKRAVPLELLAKEPLVVSEKGNLIREMVEQRFADIGLAFTPELEIDVHQLGGRDAIINAVANGVGIGFLTQSHVVSDVKAGRLKILKVPGLNLKRTMYIAVHKSWKSSSLVQAFSNLLRGYQQQIRCKGAPEPLSSSRSLPVAARTPL